MADEDNIKQLEDQLAALQGQLADAKKQAAAKAARQKVLDSIAAQRVVSKQVIDSAGVLQGQWEATINDKLSQGDRDTLQAKIDAATKEVDDAAAAVSAAAVKIAADDQALATAKDTLAGKEGEQSDAQKELSQFAAKTKEAQTKVEQLRSDTGKAVDEKEWKRAFYKNYRLKQELDKAADLLDENKRQKTLTDTLDALATDIDTAQKTVTTAKDDLETDRAALKVATQEYNDKAKGLETAIGNFL